MDESICSPTSDDASSGDDLFKDEARATSLLAGFSQLYENQQFVDVTLCVDQSDFPCHKSVLAASSPYFMAMFSTSLAEGGLSRITLKDMEAPTLELVLGYVYTGQVWHTWM
ncbi:hypothetical protein EGW08_023535 [Elysia chlorotica]|uniref:BTB domain-containing protein n=1 Tax=Elysia chlorotica TaxID=188477 RepID=A0A433SIH6_ELYCH|nr:hypothetical protein EGW08_023535 [Elysia chlorotica]